MVGKHRINLNDLLKIINLGLSSENVLNLQTISGDTDRFNAPLTALGLANTLKNRKRLSTAVNYNEQLLLVSKIFNKIQTQTLIKN